MPDSPDYQKYLSSSVRFSLQDLGELAARLGAINVHDRRGEIVWYDKCNAGLSGWNVSGGGTGNAVTLDVTTRYLGEYSFKMKTGSTADRKARLLRDFALFDIASLGIELIFSSENEIQDVTILLEIGLEGRTWRAALRYSETDFKLYYMDAAGSYVVLADLSSVAVGKSSYNIMKLVIDLEAKTYKRIIFNNTRYENLAVPFYNVAVGSLQYFEVVFDFVSNPGANGTGYIGGVIVTSNEP